MRPRILVRAAMVVACVLSIGMAPLRAQSLADVARAEEARRKEIKRPAKLYTNKDLVSVPPPAAAVAAPAPTTAEAATASTQLPATKDEKAEADGASPAASSDAQKGTARDQAYWSGRMQNLSVQLDRDRILADALQSRINGLTADFSARDDPAQRRVIALDRQKALDELDRLTKSILSDQRSITDFQEEARRASVPPGWLR